MKDIKVILSTLWIFATVNYIFCDVVSGMESVALNGFINGQVGNLKITQEFLLGAAIMMEIPFLMILLSVILNYKANRMSNIIAGTAMTIIQLGSFFAGGTPPALHYIFYSIIEIASTVLIVWLAVKWKNQPASVVPVGV